MFKPKQGPQPDYEYFTIYDSKTESYREPMLAINQFDMMRQIDTLFRDSAQEKNVLITNAEDFSLHRVGTFTKKTGLITSIQPPEHIANFHEIRSQVRNSGPNLGIVPT